MKRTSWSDHLRWFIIKWYLLSGISFVIIFYVNALTIGILEEGVGLNLSLFNGFDSETIVMNIIIFFMAVLLVFLPVVFIWPLLNIYILIECLSVFLGNTSLLFLVPTNPLLTIFSFILYLSVPFIGYTLYYLLSYKRIPRRKEDLLLPFNKEVFLGKLVREEGWN